MAEDPACLSVLNNEEVGDDKSSRDGCMAALNNEGVGNEDSLRVELKRGHQCLVDGTDSGEVPSKKQVKEAANDEVCSEVLNPTVSPRENASSYQTSTIQTAEVAVGNQVGSSEITSTGSRNSGSDSLSEEEGSRNESSGMSGAASTSNVILEVPKQASSSGIRKITFKFSKRKTDELSASVQDGSNLVRNHLYGGGFDQESGSGNSTFCAPNMELKMSKKIIPDNYPTNVKKLLSTGILEGARVKYISVSREKVLCGITRGCGYLCGCLECNFSKVLNAHEFEVHAGGKSRHPNNHIFLENGRPIYSIVQELRTTPLNELDVLIKDMVGSSFNEKSFQTWRASFQQSNVVEADSKRQIKPFSLPCQLESCLCQTVEDCLSPSSCCIVENFALEQQSHMKTSARQKRVTKNNYSPRSTIQQRAQRWEIGDVSIRKRNADGSTRRRDNELHQLLFLPIGLPDGAELAYCSKGQRVLGGYKQGNGIVCSHCNTEISPSQFEAHAGFATKRQPYRHIYTSDGLTLHDIAKLLESGQSLTTGDSDDMCTICGDGGCLILCEGCPRAFHAACLELQSAPQGKWYCSYCRIGTGESRAIDLRLTRQLPESERGCSVCGHDDYTSVIFDERTVIICDQCEREYHIGCLRESGHCDLQELPKDDWFCTDDCGRIRQSLQNLVFRGAEVVPASVLNKISGNYAVKGLAETGNDVHWQIISGKNHHKEHLKLLSKATAIFRECFDPIIAVGGRDLIPIMVYGRNISGQEFGGIYCVVLIIKSVVVSACLLRVFGRIAAELPLVATSSKHQGKGYFQALFSCVERLLHSLDVETLLLPAAGEAESIWTKKLGFRKMRNEQLLKFTKELRPTFFAGTSLLEKEVQWMAE